MFSQNTEKYGPKKVHILILFMHCKRICYSKSRIDFLSFIIAVGFFCAIGIGFTNDGG